MLAGAHIVATKSDIEDCHRLGKNGSTIYDLSIENFVMTTWEKNLAYTKILTSLSLVLLMALKFMLAKTLLITTNVLLGSLGS